MKKECIFSLENSYRDNLNVYGYRFGKGEKAACIVGSMRGDEVQQLYICSQIVKALKHLEERGAIVGSNEILVIPSVNHSSMNIGKRFWATDNTDINRMFPGYGAGETTQRIADGVFQAIQGYTYGIQFPSFYIQGDFVPHVRMMETGFQNPSLANLFGLPYVVIRKPRPIDTATLNYNWQIWNTSAFSLYTSATRHLDEASARMAVASVLRFLTRMGILRYTSHSGFIASVIREDDLTSVKNDLPGLYRRHVEPGQEVHRGQELASILDPLEGEVISRVLAPTDGIVYFAHSDPLVMEGTIVFKIIRRLHE
ncbi:MAG: succinylglutamate desuccinylase [Lachnospiraceae bacterium]|nr:succinylglutamate desuccinylase [Lachnospiraceae bacterium]MCI8959080.1 succinylglutamate desuccinylase [Lachnospiraceae bacterium]